MLSKLLPALRSALVCTLWLPATASLAQTTIHVGPGQTYTTIQSGIDAANNGDTVLVAPGTYNENVDFSGKAITVSSSGGPSVTILDGGSVAAAVTFTNGETSASIISGFTIQHGGAFTNYTAGSYAPPVGSINITGSSPTIADNIITLSNCWGIVSNYGSGDGAPTIRNNTISATQDVINGCSVTGGAAIVIWGGLTDPNSPTGYYGGLIYGNTLENNVESALEDSGGNGGAGIVLWGGSTIVANNIIRDNATPGGSGGAINIIAGAKSLIFQNLIYGNSAGCGGGALTTGGQGVYVINNTIVDNTSTDNAGYSECIDIAQIYPSPDAYGTDNPSDVFLNNIISGSTSYPAVNCSWFETPNEANQPTFQNNILYNASGPFFGSFCVDVSNKYNNIAADPEFVDSAKHNYALKSTSPAIDHGQNSVLQTVQDTYHQPWTKDLAGNPRVQDATSNGCIIDMGAYEYPGTLSQCGVLETLTSSLNPAMAGQSINFTAQLSASSGTPTGVIEFLDGTTLLASQAVSSTGSAAFNTSSLAVGSHTIIANYQPTGTFEASTASLTQVVDGDKTGTTLTCLPNPIDIDNTAQLTATVKSANGMPTGSISFTDNGASLATQGLLNGTSSLTYTGSIAGTHNITATYTPSGPFAASSATCPEVVNALPTTSTLTVAPTTSTYGSPITLTATVSPTTLPGPSTPTGVVTFLNGASAMGTDTLTGGVATLASGTLPGGSYSLTCMYSGSSIYATSNCNPVPVIIHAAPTVLTLSSSNNPAPFLSTIAFTARLTINGQSVGAGNTIHLSINGQTISLTTDATGSATYTIGTLMPNSYPITASFAATNNLLAGSASLTEVITAASTSTSLTGTPNPGFLNLPVTMMATVSSQGASTPVGSGNVTFYDGSTSLGSSRLSATGTASITAKFSQVGVRNITAVYGGDADFLGSTSAVLKEMIVAGDFSIAVLPGAASLYTGQADTIKVNVTSLHGFNLPLALTCSGLPANATCSFNPTSLPEGQGAANLVIQTAAPHKAGAGSASGSVSGSAAVLGALTLLLLPGWRRRRGFLAGLSAVLLAVGVGMGMAGCGAVSPITGGTPPGTYQVAVTATTMEAGTALTHSAVVTLTVKSLF
jgi:Bacterial Ig-like domain (group 3)/Disaggregatase related